MSSDGLKINCNNMKTIGSRLKTIRKALNCSQTDFAEKIGITKQAISNIETSKSAPSITVLNRLCIDVGINLNYLISGQGDIFINTKCTDNSIKEAILNEVEIILAQKGIC